MWGNSPRSDFDDVPDDFVLPKGDVTKGTKYFKKYCAQCHSVYIDNRPTCQGTFPFGPTLFNVYGRASGEEVIQNHQTKFYEKPEGIVWLDKQLMNYMKNPRQMNQGRVQMNFRGIADFQTRVDIVHFLKTLDWNNDPYWNPQPRPSSFWWQRWTQEKPKEQKDAHERLLRRESA